MLIIGYVLGSAKLVIKYKLFMTSHKEKIPRRHKYDVRLGQSAIRHEDLSWRLRAACDADTAEFFSSEPGDTSIVKKTRERYAKEICRECPVINECLLYAIRHKENGIWGGMTERERKKLVKKSRKNVDVTEDGNSKIQ